MSGEGDTSATLPATPRWIRALAVVSVLAAVGTLVVCTPLMALVEGTRETTYFYARQRTSLDGVADTLLTLTTCAGLVLAPLVGVVAVLVAAGRALRFAKPVGVIWTLHVGVVALGFLLRASAELTARRFAHPVTISDWLPLVALGFALFALAALQSTLLSRAATTMRSAAERAERSPGA